MTLLTRAGLLLAVLPVALAAQCTVSSSSPWPFPVTDDPNGGGGGSVTDVCAQFKDDLAAYKACTDTALAGECAAVGCPDSIDGDSTSGSGSSTDPSDLIRRATLTCTSSEECYQYVDKSLLCYNLATGDYHDDVGGKGNYLDGSYTGPSDKDSGSSSSATTHASATKTSSGGSATSAAAETSRSASASGASAAAASASTSPSSGTETRASFMAMILGLAAVLVI